MSLRSENKIASTSAITGSALLLIGTWLHPMPDDPNQTAEAFTAYAADRLWVASHLAQLAGIALMEAALVLLAQHHIQVAPPVMIALAKPAVAIPTGG